MYSQLYSSNLFKSELVFFFFLVLSPIRCMLLGHYLRGLEYRMELMELLSLPSNAENEASGGEQVA